MPAPIPDEARADIVFLAALGYTRAEIAEEAGVSRNTVRKYLRLARDAVEAEDAPRAALVAVVRAEYDWERPDGTGAGGFGDMPM